jgi:hypothetical protein
MVMLLASTALFLLAGCSAAHGSPRPDVDLWGNHYPAECRGELPSIPIIEVSAHFLEAATEEKDRLGLWSRIHVAYVLRGLDEKTRAEVVRHESCHEQMWRLTGDPRWHGDS